MISYGICPYPSYATSSWKHVDIDVHYYHDIPLNKHGKSHYRKDNINENLVPDLNMRSSAKRAHLTTKGRSQSRRI